MVDTQKEEEEKKKKKKVREGGDWLSQRVVLSARHHADDQLAHQVRVFRKHFLCTAPSRIPGQVEVGCVQGERAACAKV